VHYAYGDRAVPCWAAGAELVCRAHAAAPCSTPIVGWDLAFTDRGPVLVEGNNVPGINLMQMPIDTPLGATPVVAILLDYVRAAYGTRADVLAQNEPSS
jgi:Sugar-transfer associated ATP-grasp